jgi:very-short-patch-repair endonuclease
MAYPLAMLAIEYDGAIHVADQVRMQRDIARRRRLESMGWRIITVSAADLLNNPLEIVATVRTALAQRTR